VIAIVSEAKKTNDDNSGLQWILGRRMSGKESVTTMLADAICAPEGSLFIPENSEGFISGEIKIDSSLRIATSGQMQPARIAIILLGMGGERRKRKRRKGTPNPAASTGSHFLYPHRRPFSNSC
jgi:hypothetical protein